MQKTMKKKVLAVLLAAALVLTLIPAVAMTAFAADPALELVTQGSSGTGGDYNSERPSMSDDGNLIAFQSYATDLIDGVTANGNQNVYLYNVSTGKTTLVTEGAGGADGDGSSGYPVISGDGSRILFVSDSTDLIDGVTTTSADNYYVYNVSDGTTVLLTPGSSGNGLGSSGTWGGSISRDGGKVAFNSDATDVIDGVTLNGNANIFYCDVNTLKTTLVTKGADGTGGNVYRTMQPGISADGTLVAFQADSTDLIDGVTLDAGQNVFLYTVATGTLTLLTEGPAGLGTGQHAGGTGNPTAITPHYVIFSSAADNIITGAPTVSGVMNIYSYNIATKEIKLLTAGPGGTGGDDSSYSPSVSGDGNIVGFMSCATDLIDGTVTNGNYNAYSYNLTTGKITLLSAGPDGTGGDESSQRPTLSYDGSGFAFHSWATDLIDGLTPDGAHSNVFVRSPNQYAITVQTDGNGTASASAVSAVAGTKVKLTATPASGYQFKEWQVVEGGVSVQDGSFTMPGTAVTVKAIFEKIPVDPTEPTNPTSPNNPTNPTNPNTPPDTGDNGTPLWFLLAFAALAALSGIAVAKKRKLVK